MRALDFVIGIGWVVFWLYWLVEARNVKPGQNRWSRFAGARVALLIVIVLLFRFAGVGPHKATDDWWLVGVGVAVWAAGLALAVWARLYIGRNWGMPMTKREKPDLVTTGPYRYIRHPIYSGIILGLLGTALATTLYALIPVAVLAGLFIYSATREERFLAGEFPDAYPPYRARTKMLVPFLL